MYVRTVQFSMKPGAEEKALALLREHTDCIARSPGCGRAYMAVPIHGTSHMVYSEWDSEADIERLEGVLRSDPAASAAFFALLGLVQRPPHVARFHVLDR